MTDTTTQKLLIDRLSLKNPFISGAVIYLLIGYMLYFYALAIPEPPVWATDWIQQLASIVKALKTAARVSTHPFPAQVIILYCAFGSILLTGYFTCRLYSMKDVLERGRQRYAESGMSKARIFFTGVICLACAIGFYPTILFVSDPRYIDWRDISIFSPSFMSISSLLLSSGLPALGFPVSIFALCTAILPN